MENYHLRGLDSDLNRQIEYNRKHGGVSDKLKRMKKRPENPKWRQRVFLNSSDEEFEGEPWGWKPKKQ